MDVFGIIRAALELAKPVVEMIHFDKITERLDACDKISQELEEEKRKYPNWDDVKMGRLRTDLELAEESLKKQIALAGAPRGTA